MDLIRIHYARLRNLGNYENERVELEAQLAPDEDAHVAYEHLRELTEELLFPERVAYRPVVAGDQDDLPF